MSKIIAVERSKYCEIHCQIMSKMFQVIMGDLPKDQIEPANVFANVAFCWARLRKVEFTSQGAN